MILFLYFTNAMNLLFCYHIVLPEIIKQLQFLYSFFLFFFFFHFLSLYDQLLGHCSVMIHRKVWNLLIVNYASTNSNKVSTN